MRGQQDEFVVQQTHTLEELRRGAVDMARSPDNGLDEDSRKALRDLSAWLLDRTQRFQILNKNKTKVSVSRLRLFILQLEKLLEQLRRLDGRQSESEIRDNLAQLLNGQQQRDLYDDMIACLRELSTLSIERGQGQQAALYNDMAQRLELRLESGHIELTNRDQRAKDQALYADFQQKLELLKQ